MVRSLGFTYRSVHWPKPKSADFLLASTVEEDAIHMSYCVYIVTTVKPDELRLLPHCRKPVSHGLKVNFYAERKPKMQYVTIDR